MLLSFNRMRRPYQTIVIIVVISWHEAQYVMPQQATFDGEDINPSATIFESKVLPESPEGKLLYRYFPTVGNGHVATVVYTDVVYMNGLFNGFKGETHRARLPTRNNIRLVDKNGSRSNFQNASFSLDVFKGIFVEKFIIEDFIIEIKLFAHRYYHKIMVNQIHAIPIKPNPSPLTLNLIHDTGPISQDISFDEETMFEAPIDSKYQCGKVNQIEDPFYQQNKPTVCIIFMELPEILEIKSEVIHTFIASYDSDLYGASLDFTAVASLISKKQDMKILDSHVDAWSQVWNDGNIIIEGNLELAKVVHGCLYYIISSLPVTADTYSYVSQFYGLSPGGLANGAYFMDYQGHTFWDMEIWIFPPILYLYPEMAREVLNCRLRLIQAARKNAQDTGYRGARYPWEGGVSGRDVTPECCPENYLLQVHITADIAFAVRQYIELTRDLDWLKIPQPNYPTNGCGFIRELAEFWVSRITYDPAIKQHEINEVMGPNDDAKFVDNNAFTNVAAAYSIFFAKYAECLCNGSMLQVPEDWVEIAKSLKLVYDSSTDYHPNFEGYQRDELTKQADSVLLGFPLLYEMNPKTRENDLNIYEKVTRKTGPGMTWAMHTIGVLELDEVERADKLFARSYKSYIREPFKIWTEAEPPSVSAVNYLTGMGGFLQSILSGYGGFRLFPEKILFYKPRLPPNTTKLQFKGLSYLENVFDVIIEANKVTISLRESSNRNYLQVISGNTTYEFGLGHDKIELENGEPPITFSVSAVPSGCPLPVDRINSIYNKQNSCSRMNSFSSTIFIGTFFITKVVQEMLKWKPY